MTGDPNRELMRKIRDQWGVLIASVVTGSEVPEEFVAALVANESGGNPNAKRFEQGVFAHLWEVLQGRTPAYGSITKSALLAFFADAKSIPGPLDAGPQSLPADALQRLDGLATSWGLTQIMGYHVLEFGGDAAFASLRDPGQGFSVMMLMLQNFMRRDTLRLPDDASFLFRCWNTGRQDGVTSDPHYVANGLARMELYLETAASVPAEQSSTD